jgi:hypothetical protein
MQFQLFLVAEAGHHGDGQQRARAPVQTWPRPHPAPGRARDKGLKIAVEIRDIDGGTLNMRCPQHLFAHRHPGFIKIRDSRR